MEVAPRRQDRRGDRGRHQFPGQSEVSEASRDHACLRRDHRANNGCPRPAGRPPPVTSASTIPYAAFLKVLLLFHPPSDPLPPGHPSVGRRRSVGDARRRTSASEPRRDRRAMPDRQRGESSFREPCSVSDVTVGATSLLYANVTVREGMHPWRAGDHPLRGRHRKRWLRVRAETGRDVREDSAARHRCHRR